MQLYFINPSSGLQNFSYEIPLNISQLIACVKHFSFIEKITVIDFELNGFNEEALIDIKTRGGLSVVCIPIYTYSWQESVRICQIIKKYNKNVVIIMGGPHATLCGEKLLQSYEDIDYIIQGEGDSSLPKLLYFIQTKKTKNFQINGLIFRNNNGSIKKIPRAPRIENIDKLPRQTDGFTYFDLKKIKENIGFVPYIASRGCPFNCIFCSSSHLWQRKLFYLSPNVVKKEVEKIISFGFKYINFRDDFFTMNKKWLLEILDILKELKIIWGCETRIDFIDKELLLKMKESGCELIRFGIETFNQKSLDLLRKNFDAQKAIENLNIVSKIGFKEIRPSFIIGVPGETQQDIENTLNICRRFKNIKYRFWSLSPVLGTELYNNMDSYGIKIKKNVCQSTYSNIETSTLSNEKINNLLVKIYAEFQHPLSLYHRDFSDICLPASFH